MKFQHYLLVVLKKLNFLKKLNLIFIKKTSKSTFKIPINKGIGHINLYESELWMDNILKVLLSKNNGDFIDIGANLGQTLLKVKNVDTNINYYGFEPNPVCFSYLNELIDANNFKNVQILPLALSNKTHILKLNLYSDDVDQAATIIENYRPNNKILKSFHVPVFNFAEIENYLQINEISVIKIDVEGAENEIIKSAASLLRSQRPFVICEILPVYSKENIFRKERTEDIETFLIQENYIIFRFNDLKLEKLATIGIHSDMNLTNYLFCPAEKETFLTDELYKI